MKPHLPVSLFRALLLITMATATTAWSAVTVLTEDAEIKNQSSALMTKDSESMGYTSADSNARKDLTISGSSSLLYILGQDKDLSFEGLDVFSLVDNKAVSAEGALIRDLRNTTGQISISDNSQVIMNNNDSIATDSNMYGGVIRSTGHDLHIDNNGKVEIKDNNFSSTYADGERTQSNTYGGAVYFSGAAFSMSNNGDITISGNSLTNVLTQTQWGIRGTTAHGGAIDIGTFATGSSVTWDNNASITVSGNSAIGYQARGGALHSKSELTISNTTGSIVFSENSAVSEYSMAYGGAISLEWKGKMTFSDNASIDFLNNATKGYGKPVNDPQAGGAALHLINNNSFIFKNNGDISFVGNVSSNVDGRALGGAIYAAGTTAEVLFSGNDSVTFSGNGLEAASGNTAYGGAIYSRGGVSFRDNTTVLFEKNYEKTGDEFRLRSIHAKDYSTYQPAPVNLVLSAADGGSITFKDSITVSGNLDLNAKYDDKAQTGSIIFTGATTESDLNDIIADYTPEGETARTATDAEIAASRTSEVVGTITLNAGKLSVQEGAMLNAGALDVKAGATLAVEGIEADKVTETTVASLTTGSLTMDAEALFELNFSSDYLKNTTGGDFKMYVADISADSESETPLTLTSEQLSVGSVTWDATGLEWSLENGKAYISGSLVKAESVSIDGQPEVSEDISDIDKDNSVAVTINGDTTLSGDNSHTGGTTITDADVKLGSETALGDGAVVTDGTASITTTEGLSAKLPSTIQNSGNLTLNGEFDVSGIVPPADTTEVDTRVCVDGKEGRNGFFRDGDTVVNVVANGNNGTLKVGDDTVITKGGKELHLADSGKAGELDYSEYHIVDTDHAPSIGEIQDMRPQTEDGKTLTIDMTGGTLLVKEGEALSADTQVKTTGGAIETEGAVTVGGDQYQIGGTTSVVVEGESEAIITGENDYTGNTVISGEQAKLTVETDKALGKSTVYLQEHGTLDLNSQAVGNDIYVEGCTICDAADYTGNITVTGDLELVDTTNNHIARANKVTFVAAGNISSSNATLIVNSVEMASDATGEINSDLTTNEGGTIILNNGSQLKVNGALTLGKGTTFVLKGNGYAAGSELGYGDPTADSITTGSATLANGRGTFAINENGVIYLTAVFDQDIANACTISNWGMATASRAFVNAVRGQRTNTGCIANGRGTAWVAVLGGNHDIDGSDIDLKGAAVGADVKVGEKSSVGIAFGYVEGDVRPTGLRSADQEGTYVALYGEHGLRKLSSTSCLSLDWVATYGNTESDWAGMDWEQQSLQLNSRLNWNKKVSDRLCVSVFGGLEYYTSESDTVENVKTGSIQNLRGEIGVGARYVAWGTPAVTDGKSGLVLARGCEKLVLHGEIRYMNDMVRSNPVIEQDGLRGKGDANPGRQGMGIEAGATYRIGERWSASANYGFNTMDDSREHRVNVGASYTF